MKISFIIPSYNSLKTLPNTLESIFKQSGHEFEIIIVDSSDDPVVKKQTSLFACDRVKVISLDKKTGPAQGRNIGAREAKGELLCFIDSDVILSDHWLKEILLAYQQGCRAGGGAVDIHQSQIENNLAWAQLYLQFNESLPIGQRRDINLLPGCNMFCERKLFFEVGGFPDIRASEDVVFCLKVREKNSLWFVPAARAYHIFRESVEAYRKNQILLGKYILLYRRDYLKSWYYQGLWPLLFLPAFVLIKFLRMVLRIQKNSKVYRKKFYQVLPLFLLGLWYWTLGFAGAVIEGEEKL